MRRAFLPLVVAIVLVGVACSSDDSGDTLASTATVEALFDGSTCIITASDPGYVAADEEGVDLLAAAPDASLAFILTNTSGMDITGLVNRYDPALSVEGVLAAEDAFDGPYDEDGTLYDKPDFIVGAAMVNFSAKKLSLDENQLQYHYTLQPGLSTTIVHTSDGIWGCDTSPEGFSLIDVPHTESTSS